MRQKVQALVLGIVRHSDSTDVATLYTRQAGRVSVAVPAMSSRRRRYNPALMSLALIEGELDVKGPSTLARLWRFSLINPLQRLRMNPAKTAVGMFVAEFLGRLLREQVPDPQLWQTVVGAMCTLDAETNPTRIANFHIVLLWQMLAPAGITPDLDLYDPALPLWLDMRRGSYTSVRPSHSDILAPRYAFLPPLLGRLNFRNSHRLRISGEQRYHICEALLHYYAVHLPGLGSMRSHHILRSIFS